MFSVTEAFEVEGLLVGGSAAIFTADLAPATWDYPEVALGSLCLVADGTNWIKSIAGWVPSSLGANLPEYVFADEELVIANDELVTL